jgi:hypothetical protein
LTAAASKTEELWTKACREQTGSSNTFMEGGARYFYERGRENDDGAYTGTIYRMAEHGINDFEGQTAAFKVASFRINPDGTVERAPKFLKAASKARDKYLRETPGARERALATGA